MAERMAARPNADKQKQGSARKGAGLCTTRDLVRSLTLSYVSRGLSPSRIVDKMLDFANSQNDPSIRKVIAFQLMDKVGRMEGVDKQTITRIADCMAPIFSKLPEAARKNFQKLSNEVSAIHSFSPVSMEKMAERTRLD
ncbi:TPA: hypothetical protein EYP38_02660, partial [Candidatus Micrarchaeota archaeon]|nr:hypothetical protein [Candidatus Micrarchaeota archaeon]